jgi:uncharacterized protein (DUF58 family)
MAIDTAFLDELGRFSLVVNKRVTSNYVGARKSTAYGRGVTFKEHRIYSPGDDFRLIDWKIFARTDNLYIKTFEEERNLTVHILIDASSSMVFGDKVTKFNYACMIGVGFAYLAIKENEKFQYSTFSDTLEIFQSKKGMGQLAGMIFHLNSMKCKGQSKFKDAISQYRKVIGSRAMIIVVSDFLFPIEEITEALYLFGEQEIKVVQVLDPVEKNLALHGDFDLKDSESDSKLRTYISPRMSQQYQKEIDQHSAKIEKVCNELGMKFHLCVTNTPIFDTFHKILM